MIKRLCFPILLALGLSLSAGSVLAGDAGPEPAAAVDAPAADVPVGVDESPAEGIGTSPKKPSELSNAELAIGGASKIQSGAILAGLALLVILAVRVFRGPLARLLGQWLGSKFGGYVFVGATSLLTAWAEAFALGESASWALAWRAGQIAVTAVLGYHALTEKPALGGAVAKAVKG